MNDPSIDVRNLTVTLTGKHPRLLLDDVTLSVTGGRILALVGESGAGKSMASLAIMGLLPQWIKKTGGSIAVNGMDLDTLNAEGMRRLRNRDVAMILQNPMSAFDAIFSLESHFDESLRAAGIKLSKKDLRERAANALQEVGLHDPQTLLASYPFQLSGGMLQRVMIAIALLCSPAFLIADECTTDLDAATQVHVLQLLKERQQARRLGVLLITHDLSVASYMSDEIAIMREGRIVERGDTKAVFRKPQHAYTQELIASYRSLNSERFEYLTGRRDITWKEMTA